MSRDRGVRPSPPEQIISIIAPGMRVVGDCDADGAIRIEGTVKGKIISTGCVTVGSTGLVEAEIEAESAIVAGAMRGNVNTTEKIELQAKCEMEGDIKAKSLVIEQGALFCGACNMKGQAPDLGFLPPEEKEEPVFADQSEANEG